MSWKTEAFRTRALAAAGALLATPAALAAHPHEGAAGFPHGLLHFFLGAGHLLPVAAAALIGAAAGGAAFLALRSARGVARERREV